MMAQSSNLSPGSIDLISRFHDDCKLRGFGYPMDYIYRVTEFCAFLETRGKTPMSADKDDIKAFLVHLNEREIKFKTVDRIFTCISSLYGFLIEEELVENNPVLPFRKRLAVTGNDRAGPHCQITQKHAPCDIQQSEPLSAVADRPIRFILEA